MLNIKLVSLSRGLFMATSFILCIVYGLIVPSSMHRPDVLEAVLPGFKWLTTWGFFLGLLESLLYGVYVGLVYVPIYNFMHRNWMK